MQNGRIICQHKIKLEKDAKPVVDHQRRLNPKMKEVVRKEMLKLLEAGVIYPVADSKWVSPVHCVPKKGGVTVVPNDKDELIPQRIITGYRMCRGIVTADVLLQGLSRGAIATRKLKGVKSGQRTRGLYWFGSLR